MLKLTKTEHLTYNLLIKKRCQFFGDLFWLLIVLYHYLDQSNGEIRGDSKGVLGKQWS